MDTRCVRETESSSLDGWDDPPGSGRLFLASQFGVINTPLDGICSASSEFCTALGRTVVPAGSERLRGFLEGPTLTLIEIAGLDAASLDRDEHVTVKLYAASAASPCLAIDQDQFRGAQAATRLRAAVNGGGLVSTTTAAARLDLGVRLSMHRLRFAADLVAPGELQRVVLGTALPARALAAIPNPHCDGRNPLCPSYPVEGSLLEAVAYYSGMDVDLDEPTNGLERVELGVDGRVEVCFQEDGSRASGRVCADEFSDAFSSAHALVASPTRLPFCSSAD